mmetsp:Transcript_30269/g.59943  ORF Transcript_30269/g.59943 Transcript_30269/m.59943 type:complete len:80 (-) Transcript_30269:58-297(-)
MRWNHDGLSNKRQKNTRDWSTVDALSTCNVHIYTQFLLMIPSSKKILPFRRRRVEGAQRISDDSSDGDEDPLLAPELRK